MRKSTRVLVTTLGCVLGAAVLLPRTAHAGLTDLASQPLAQPAASVKPNIMLLFDDSGSMRQQYTPDYIGRFNSGDSNAMCFDSLDSGGAINNNLQNCQPGDPPVMSPDFNTQYYNPAIQYLPAVNYDGTLMPSMNAANTSNWTAVPTDGVSPSTINYNRYTTINMFPASSAPYAATANIVTNYPDREWCNSKSASTSYPNANCRTNSNYSYPDGTYGYGTTSIGALRFTTGAPYFYRIVPSYYCTDYTLVTCTASTTPTTIGGVNYSTPAAVRFCTDTTFSNCKSKYIPGSYTIPQFTGVWNNTAVAQATSTATVTVQSSQPAASGTIQNITANGTNLFGPAYSAGVSAVSPMNASTIASNLALAINNGTASNGGYTATASGRTVTIFAGTSTTCNTPGDCTQPNGNVVTVASNATGYTSATASFTITGVYNNRSIDVQVNSDDLTGGGVTCSSCSTSSLAASVALAINTNNTAGYSASSSASTVTITAPANTGASYNSTTVNIIRSGFGTKRIFVSPGTPSFGGGITNGVILTGATNFSGGTNAAAAGRSQVGQFVRTNIVSGQTYPLYPGRNDCVTTPGICTYAEEMTNFANWYAYYRTRNEMAKTAIGRAFVALTNGFRVGFVTINPGNPVSPSRFLAIDDFTAGAGNQKANWYQQLYAAPADSGTPLREGVARVGQYLAGLGSTSTPLLANGMGASPIQVACQPNYTVLVTDGYWNGNAGQTLSGGSIGNQDNTDAGYHTRAIGAYDGGLAGSTNTLADTAMYYYQTDLRPDLPDEVPTTQNDPNPAQHMNFFGVIIGQSGQLNFDPNYLSENSSTGGDFWQIKQGGLNWPVPSQNDPTALDDLWHAAVDGHGQFFTAKDPVTLSNAITSTLANVSARVGAGAAAATSNLQPVAGDNFAFTAQYETVVWTGDLQARTIDLSTGIVSNHSLWSAQALLDQRTQYDRNIFTFDPADTTAGGGQNGNLLKSFCWPGAFATGNYPGCGDGAELSAAQMSDFTPLTLPQSIGWATDGSGRNTSATSQNLVDYLRGDTTNESTGGTATTDLYRNRADLLGDIVDAQPAYVKAAPFGYDSGSFAGGQDQFYQTFAASTNGTSGTRAGTVFAASNDGMLHAFNTQGPSGEIYYQTGGISTATTTDDTFTGTLVASPVNGQGSERWAYVPSMLLPQLQNLADIPYSHQYYVDGSPAVGDVCFGETLTTKCPSASNWHTILVGGLNAGGRGYYALDITDPNNPRGLWEFSATSSTPCLSDLQANSGSFFQDCNLGYSFGNPLIVKRADTGQWVVIVSSGYNNVNPGNGQGYLYILDAQTGKILNRIGTGVGCDGVSTTSPCVAGTTDPSGLNKINAWVDNAFFDNTAKRVYGVDLKGNVWRFQLDSSASDYLTATRLETVTDPSGIAQPITTKPELALVSNFPVVYVTTGRLLGTSDLSNIQVQSIYALKDTLSTTALPNVRTSGTFVQQTLSLVGGSTTTRTATNNPVDFTTQNGWWVDLPDSGERVNVDPQLQLGTLIVASNVPSPDTCLAGGSGWLNFFNYQTGSFVPGVSANMVSTQIPASLVVGINVVKLPGGEVKAIATTADNQQLTQTAPVAPSSVQGRRVNWRELISQ